MLEFISSYISIMLRDDRAWYACSIMILFSTLTMGFYDLYLQTPQLEIIKSQKISISSSDNFVEKNVSTIHKFADASHWDFFGTPELSLPELDIEALPESALDLKLIGTFTSDTQFSSAVIKTGDGKSKRVFLHQPILDGVTLHTINELQVVVNRGSILETLKLYDLTASDHAANPNRPSYNHRASEPLTITAPGPTPGNDFHNSVAQQRKERKERRARYMAPMNAARIGIPGRAL